jgi:signal transduction histidine kinase
VLLYIPFSVAQGNYMLALLQFIDTLFVVSVLWLNNRGYYTAARLAYMGVINSFVLINSCIIGYESKVHEFFYISYMVPFLLFRVKQYRAIATGVVMAVVFFYVYQYIYPFFTAYNLSVADQLVIFHINTWMKFILFGMAVYILAQYNYANEQELEALNMKLQEQTENLKRSNKDLEQFAYIVSHDLKAPVRNISSFMNLLLTRFSAGFPEGARDFVQMSKTSSDRLAKQIDDFLCYCRVDRNLPPAAPVDLDEMLTTIKMELNTKAHERNATITVARQLPVLNQVHSSMIYHVFQNLVANGIKFNTGDKPEVVVDYAINDKQVVFEVRDNGIGIDKAYESKLFQMFKRLHTNDQFEGTGIGLAVCKKIVTFYGGSITFESTPGQGTSFFVSLPASLVGERPAKDIGISSPKAVLEAA